MQETDERFEVLTAVTMKSEVLIVTPAFRRKILLPSSGSKCNPSEELY
jgi:hypothetical protein